MQREKLDQLISTARRSAWGGLTWEDDSGDGSVTEGEGRFLYDVVRMLNPLNILEVGTSHGFSTIHLAQACQDNEQGRVITIEINRNYQNKARANVEQMGLTPWVTFQSDFDHLAVIDFAFLDAEHTADAVRGYLNRLGACRWAVVHDACWNNHVAQAIEGTSWKMCLLPTDSQQQLALLLRLW